MSGLSKVCHPSVDLGNGASLCGHLSVFCDMNSLISGVSWCTHDAAQPSLPYELASEGYSASGLWESYLLLQGRIFTILKLLGLDRKLYLIDS